jgi:hypothetical protein
MHPPLRDLVTADVAASPAAHTGTQDRPTTPTPLKRAGCISSPEALLNANLDAVRRPPAASW